MATKFLDNTGLAYFWTKIKAYIANLGYMLKTATNKVTIKEFLFRDVDNDALRIGGGSDRAKGANILLYGKDHTDNPGRVDFQAYDGTNYSTLKFEPTDTRPTFYWLNSNNSGTKQIAYLTDIPDLSKTISGNGNAVTDVSISGYVINVTKGSIFLTSASTLDATKLSGTIPSGCYTDTTYTAGTGLSLSGTQFSLASHNQASDTINLMTGYSKPDSSSAITTSDTLNQAIGKLEKAIDDADISNVVHLTGDESIAGTKTFTSDIKITKSTPRIVETATNLERGNYTSSSATYGDLLAYNDKNNHSLFRLYSTVVNSNSNYFSILVYPIANTDNTYVTFKTGYDNNGVAFTSAVSTPLPADRNDANDILTRDWIPKDTRIVRTSGDQTISGKKTFASDIIVGNHDVVAPSDDTYTCFCGGSGESRYKGARLAVYGTDYTNPADNSGKFSLTSTPGGSTYYELAGDKTGLLTWRGNKVWAGISSSGSGNAVTAISVGTNNVVTVTKGSTFLTSHQSLDGCVKTSGNQTIAGTKTFSARPVFNNGITLGSSEIYRDVNNSSVVLSAGSSAAYTNGAKLTMYGATYSDSGDTTYRGGFRLMTGTADHHYDLIGLKGGGLSWNGNAVQTSSDERIKTKLQNVDDGILLAWDKVDWGEFKYLAAVEEKGEKDARLHIGLVAQQVINAFKKQDLDICKYGICCHDTSIDPDTKKQNDLWMVRYTEALCMEAAYQRSKNKILENRISELEKQVSDMLQTLQSLKGAN